jgi:predicted RNase H-like nuclease (RuvC/YqgF family)
MPEELKSLFGLLLVIGAVYYVVNVLGSSFSKKEHKPSSKQNQKDDKSTMADDEREKIADLKSKIASFKEENIKLKKDLKISQQTIRELNLKVKQAPETENSNSKFSKVKRAFAQRFHPNNIHAEGIEKIVKEEFFKEFWEDIQNIEREK